MCNVVLLVLLCALVGKSEGPESITLALVSRFIFRQISLTLNFLSETVVLTCSYSEELAQARNLGIVPDSSWGIPTQPPHGPSAAWPLCPIISSCKVQIFLIDELNI